MLIGKTTMKVTHATMARALQEYFDRTFAEGRAPKVRTITHPSFGATNEFEVGCDDGAEPLSPDQRGEK